MSEQQSWRLTDRERRTAFTAAASAFSVVLGPWGPLAVWCLEFVYDRRDLIFSPSGAPVSAYTAARSPIGLSTLAGGLGAARSTLAIDTSLTPSARGLGLRVGDPVSLAVTGHNYARSGSGLVVPARIGERVTLTVPNGSYSVTAFGSQRDNLFRLHDPYSTVAGDNISAQGYRQIGLPLVARSAPPLRPSTAFRPLTQPTSFRCDRCHQRFATAAIRDQHMHDWHPFITWVRDWFD